MTELDIDEASAILQLIDENIQSVYQQLEGEVEAGQSVLSKMPELIIAYDKLKEEKEHTKAETELVKESYRLTAGELGKQQALKSALMKLESCYHPLKISLMQSMSPTHF